MAQAAFILLVLEDEARGRRLGDLLRRRRGHACHAASTVEAALESIRTRPPDLVVADARIRGAPSGPPLAEVLDRAARDATLLLLGDDGGAVEVKDVRVEVRADDADDDDDLVRAIDASAARAVARREDRRLRETLEEQRDANFHGIVGVSREIRKTVERIRKAARTKLTVLIVGETGSGKELIAEAIHKASDRARKPFKPVNCAGLSESLLESELFGHVRGAFTGAVADRRGYFQASDGGTLFLDEVGDMPLAMQAKLLRALDRREITPVGSTDTIHVDVRVVAATNRDLVEAVENKQFRADLLHRLRQWEISVPPLRERRQDIPLLAHHLLGQANREHGVRASGISSEAMACLTRYYWPGNVREMANLMAALATEVVDRQIEVEDLPEYIRGSREIVPASAGGLVGLTLEQVERMMIERTLQATGGNREQAAKMLDIGTRTLYRKIKEYGL